ncbi:MAG: DUF2806 domain-containing protein [Betaproteobacteria bacterium]|nr:DUF2806 domain-containing protein [Betaproteobacteria bacterium]
MSDGTSLINLGELSKPATVLIEKISAAVGVLYEPHHIKRVAQAEAEAEKIKALAQIEISEIQQRALVRMVQEEGRNQENIERIAAGAAERLDSKADPSNMENDWIANFFEKCKTISDAEMQSHWSALLAGEASQPGTFSKRTVELVSTLDKQDALLFTKLCSFGIVGGDVFPVVFDHRAEIYKSAGINFTTLNHLEAIGLIRYGGIQTFLLEHLPQRFAFTYFGKPLLFQMPAQSENKLDVGTIMLTKAGQQLAKISGAAPIPEFPPYLLSEYKKKGVQVEFPSA